jgi:hypothetical protein
MQWIDISMGPSRGSSTLTLTWHDESWHILHLEKLVLVRQILHLSFLLSTSSVLIYICVKVRWSLGGQMLVSNTVVHVRIFTRVVCFLIGSVSDSLFDLSFWSWAFRFGELLNVHGSLSYILRGMVNLPCSWSVIHIGLLSWGCHNVYLRPGVHFETTLRSSFHDWDSFVCLA